MADALARLVGRIGNRIHSVCCLQCLQTGKGDVGVAGGWRLWWRTDLFNSDRTQFASLYATCPASVSVFKASQASQFWKPSTDEHTIVCVLSFCLHSIGNSNFLGRAIIAFFFCERERAICSVHVR